MRCRHGRMAGVGVHSQQTGASLQYRAASGLTWLHGVLELALMARQHPDPADPAPSEVCCRTCVPLRLHARRWLSGRLGSSALAYCCVAAALYTLDGEPWLLDARAGRPDDLVPTVMALWRAPALLPAVPLRHAAVSHFILSES